MKAGEFNALPQAWSPLSIVGVGSVLWVCHKKFSPEQLELDPDADFFPDKYIAVSQPVKVENNWTIRASAILSDMFSDSTSVPPLRMPRLANVLPSLGLPITLDSWQEDVRVDGTRLTPDSVRGLLEASCGPDVARVILAADSPRPVANPVELRAITA